MTLNITRQLYVCACTPACMHAVTEHAASVNQTSFNQDNVVYIMLHAYQNMLIVFEGQQKNGDFRT